MDASKIALIIAIYGALISTGLLVIQIVQHLRDRYNLVITATMRMYSCVNQHKARLILDITAINKGRRVVKIERVEAILPSRPSSISGFQETSSATSIFDSEIENTFIELNEGDKYVFKQDPFNNQFAASIYNHMKKGIVRVILTSGKIIEATFEPMHPTDLEKMDAANEHYN